ncbi:MAG: 50S ribosomal protein L16 [Euryarchaeota archaeon]|nr:50S ribosomal protein L16 [Euryarchaeota archaeon]
MARKPNSMYRYITQHANTRREYMGGVPMSRIQQYESGERTGTFEVSLTLVAEERCQIRHTAMESARISATRYLEKKSGKGGFHIKFRIFPHHVLRENKQATGAGADRVSQGMRQAFGKPVGTAARVESGQALITVRVNARNIIDARDALRKSAFKFPTPCTIRVDQGADVVEKALTGAKIGGAKS